MVQHPVKEKQEADHDRDHCTDVHNGQQFFKW